MFFGDQNDFDDEEEEQNEPQDDQHRLGRNVQEEIMTKEDYIDDVEEE